MGRTDERAVQLEHEVIELLENDNYTKATDLLQEMESLVDLDHASTEFLTFAKLRIAYEQGSLTGAEVTAALEKILEKPLAAKAKGKGKKGSYYLELGKKYQITKASIQRLDELMGDEVKLLENVLV